MEFAEINPVLAIRKALNIPTFKLRLYSRKNTDEAMLVDAAKSSHEILFKTNTVFPFTLFPDTVVVDGEKLSMINRYFFGVAKITSVPIRDILSVEADVGPFFGSVYMTSRYFFTNPHSVNFLWRKDAIRLQRLLQGYIIAHERNINCQSMDRQELVNMLLDLGQSNEKQPFLQPYYRP